MDPLEDPSYLTHKALYNSLRMNWLRYPNIEVEAWQVEDYRALRDEELLSRLAELDIHLTPESFLSFAEVSEGPEALADELMESEEDDELCDQAYLLLFELWRRLAHDQPCITVFCDEIDHQMDLYDRGVLEEGEELDDAIAALKAVLDENTDQGGDPIEVFQTMTAHCAHDLESFLYDYIADQIDQGNEVYAAELVDNFYDYVDDVRWFNFLRARLAMSRDPIEAHELVEELLTEDERTDLELNLEVLSFLVQGGQRPLFIQFVDRTLPLIKEEEDAQDLLALCAEFCHLLDEEDREALIKQMLQRRQERDLQGEVAPEDPDILALPRILDPSTPPTAV